MNVDLIRRRREELGLSQKELANLCGVSENSIYNYESGKAKPTKRNLQNLAQCLALNSTDILFNFTELTLSEYWDFLDKNKIDIVERVCKLFEDNQCGDITNAMLELFENVFYECVKGTCGHIGFNANRHVQQNRHKLCERINVLASRGSNSDFGSKILEAFEELSESKVIYLPKADCIVSIGKNAAFKCHIEVFEYQINSLIAICKNFKSLSGEQITNDDVTMLIRKSAKPDLSGAEV